jgi:hypothetical protein
VTGAREQGAGGEVVGRRPGLTNRAIESVGLGRVDLARMGRLGQKSFGLLNYLGQPARIKIANFYFSKNLSNSISE